MQLPDSRTACDRAYTSNNSPQPSQVRQAYRRADHNQSNSSHRYSNTAIKVCEDKVNKENVDIAISELENFCQRRKEENYINDYSASESIKILYNRLKKIQNK